MSLPTPPTWIRETWYPVGPRYVIEGDAGMRQLKRDGKRTLYKSPKAALLAVKKLLKENTNMYHPETGTCTCEYSYTARKRTDTRYNDPYKHLTIEPKDSFCDKPASHTLKGAYLCDYHYTIMCDNLTPLKAELAYAQLMLLKASEPALWKRRKAKATPRKRG